MQRVLFWAVVLFAVIYLAKNPAQVAGWVHGGFNSLSTFASSLGGGR